MDEFSKLFLRGRYAEDMKKFVRCVRAFALCGAVLLLLAAAVSWQELPFWVAASFSVTGFAVEGVANVLALTMPLRLEQLALEQHMQNTLLKEGEGRRRHEALYRAYRTAFARFSSGKRLALMAARLLAPAALAVSSLLVSGGVVVDEALIVVFFLFVLLAGGAGVYDALCESRARAKFYSLAQGEIDAVKREELHVTEERAAKEAESARAASSIPAPVELFLKEDTEKEDFRAVSKKGTVLGVFLGVLYFSVLVVGISCGNALETLGAAVSWTLVLAVFAVIFAVSVVAIFPVSRRQREIFARNFRKLGDSERDVLRKNLQTLWIRSQWAGNIMFGCFTAGAVALGIALGLISYFTNADGMPLAQSLAVSVLPILVYAALLSLVVWTVMYAVARRKMRPVEAQLRECMRTE